MNYQLFYLTTLFGLGFLASLSFWSIRKLDIKNNIRFKRNRYTHIIDFVKRRVNEKEINKLFQQSGLKLTSVQYQITRYVIFSVWFLMLNSVYYLKMGEYPSTQIITLFIIFFTTTPNQYFLGKKTPFKLVLDMLIHNYKVKKNIEIYRTISQLKNIALAKKNNPPGSDFILEQIRKFTRTTRPVFNRMIALWSMGNKEQACDYLAQAIDTKEAIELANILRKLDDLHPIELNNQIILIQQVIKKERKTKKIKTNEDRSNLIYFFVVFSSIIVMINFVVVVYYIDAIKQLQFLK